MEMVGDSFKSQSNWKYEYEIAEPLDYPKNLADLAEAKSAIAWSIRPRRSGA